MIFNDTTHPEIYLDIGIELLDINWLGFGLCSIVDMEIVLNSICHTVLAQMPKKSSEILNGCFKKPTNRSIAASGSKNPIVRETLTKFKFMLCSR